MSRTYGGTSTSRRRSPSPSAGPSRRPYDRDRDRDREGHRDDRRRRRDRHDSDSDMSDANGAAAAESDEDATEAMYRSVPTFAALNMNMNRARRGGRGDPDDDDGDENGGGGGGGEGDGDGEEDERLKWTTENFRNVPVDLAAAQKDLRNAREAYDRLVPALNRGIDEVIENARDLEMVAPDHPEIDKMQQLLMRLINADKEREIRRTVVQELLDELRNGATFNNLEREAKKRGDERVAAWNSLTAREKFKDDEKFKEFRTGVWDVHHDDEPIPPMTRWLPREGDDESDDEVQVGGTLQTYRCPITLTHLENACKSNICGHHYSWDAIMNHIGASRGPTRAGGGAKCPVGACNAVLTKKDIVRDPRMQKLTDAFVAKMARRQAEDEEEFEVLDE